MPQLQTLNLIHKLDGGWVTNASPVYHGVPDGDTITIPYLVDAKNIEYQLPIGVRKIGGTTRVNASDIGSSTTTITGIYDYWRQGTSGTATRRRVCHAGTQIYADTDDTVFASLATGLESGVAPHYATFDDLLIIGSSSTTDVPRSWDQTTFQNLAGSPPRFSFSAKHQNRHWAAGVYTAPSTLYYSVSLDPEDWTGSGSGSISIDPNDGDMITAIYPWKNELIVFKGPYKGSIHRITGTTPSTFARTPWISGLGATWQNTVVPFGDDLAFQWSAGTIHSMKATDAYGDYANAFLTFPIDNWIQDYINKARLKLAWGVNDSLNGRMIFALSRNAVQSNDIQLVYDYRFSPGRWAYRDAYPAASLGYFVDGGGQERRVYAGGTNGRIRRIDMPMRSLDGSTAYTGRATLPYLNYGSSMRVKSLFAVGLGLNPTGNYNITVGETRDGKQQQTYSINAAGGDVWTPAPSGTTAFTWNNSVWGGQGHIARYTQAETGGEFRNVQYQISNAGADQKMEVYEIYAQTHIGGITLEALN